MTIYSFCFSKEKNGMVTHESIVLKIGTHTLLDQEDNLRESVIEAFFVAIKEAKKKNTHILLVTSGAVGLGRTLMATSASLPRAIAGSVGQAYLMSRYVVAAQKCGIVIGQLLLSRPHVLERAHFLRLQTLVGQMCDAGITPIINENDAMTAETDWSFGDNDSLAAILAVSFGARELILATHVDGLYTSDPLRDQSAQLITEIRDVNRELMKYCSASASEHGRGGMISKLTAARICTNVGVATRIVNGTDSGTILGAIAGASVGTYCQPRTRTRALSNRERWIVAAKSSAASIEVDDGAVKALRQGKSLLAVGIKKLYGEFAAGESVEVVDKQQEGVAFGIVDVGTEQMLGRPFQVQHGVQVIHADNCIVL